MTQKNIHSHLFDILKVAHTTEKSVKTQGKKHQIAFRVNKLATKSEIKRAVEKLFSVEVETVRTVNTPGKVKNFKNTPGKRSSHKKAYVVLKEGHDVNLANFD